MELEEIIRKGGDEITAAERGMRGKWKKRKALEYGERKKRIRDFKLQRRKSEGRASTGEEGGEGTGYPAEVRGEEVRPLQGGGGGGGAGGGGGVGRQKQQQHLNDLSLQVAKGEPMGE
ncbi:adult-specific cuticular protein ACP-22-like [Palaemon carinicauda]|uniref:adult-specific cuticular protein ACP-22-like n=1 Tax=Palaemon carinicauda TaxID=392227 RepID=UPI0035B6A601